MGAVVGADLRVGGEVGGGEGHDRSFPDAAGQWLLGKPRLIWLSLGSGQRVVTTLLRV